MSSRVAQAGGSIAAAEAGASAAQLEEIIAAQRELVAVATDPEKVMALAVKLARRIARSRTAGLYTLDGDWMVRRAASGYDVAAPLKLSATDSLTGLCFRSGVTQLCPDAEDDPRVDLESCRRQRFRSIALVPLVSSRGAEGALAVSSDRARAFSAADVKLLEMLGGVIGAALEVASLFRHAQTQTDAIWSELEESNRSEQAHRMLFDENPTPMYIFAPATLEILRANKAALALYGYAAEEFVGSSLLMLRAQVDHASIRNEISKSVRADRTVAAVQICKDGTRRDVIIQGRAFDLDGRLTRLSIVNDITERRRAEQQLAATQNQLMQADKMSSVGQLAAGVAHEINNPIGYVYSNLGTLGKYLEDLLGMLDVYGQVEKELPPASPARAALRRRKEDFDLAFLRGDVTALMAESREGITRVKKIVQDLKDFSHAEIADEWQTADLHRGLDSTLNIAHNEFKYKATVVKDYGELPDIECLPTQLNQVFMNLMVNAAHSIKDTGTITLRTSVRGEEVCVEISDTGCGIPQENLKRIFDPFFTTKPVGKGTGLGLSLSYGIVQKHGGRIEVESEPGKGSAFQIFLPQRRAPAAV